MHRHDALGWQQIIENAEHRLLHFTSISRAADENQFLTEIDSDDRFAAAAMAFRISPEVWKIDNCVFRNKARQFFLFGTHQQCPNEKIMPGIFVDDANANAMFRLRSAKKVSNKQRGVGDTNGRNAGVNGNSGCSQPGGNAGANTGGGGGGGTHYNTNNKGGEGGSGIVIVRYNGPQAASGGTYTFANGVSFHTFTSSGTFTPNSTHTTWHDATNRGHNFTLENGPVFNSSNSGYLAFDGTNDIATILTTPASLQGNSNLTVCGFFRRTGNIARKGIFGIGGEGTNGGINSWNYDNTNEIAIDTWGQSTFTTGVTYPLNEWVFVAWQKTAGAMTRANCRLWRNLVSYTGSQLSLLRSETGSPNINSYGVTVGSISRTTEYCAAMDVGTFFIYDRVLTPAEIAQNFNATRSRFGI